MGSGGRGEQTCRGNSGYSRSFHQNFQTNSRSMDKGESFEGEDREHQSNFAQIDESNETSPGYFAEEWEIAKSREEKKKW